MRDVDEIALPYAAKVIRELFMNSAEAGAMGMSTVPLSELYGGAERFLRERGGEVSAERGRGGRGVGRRDLAVDARDARGRADCGLSGACAAV